MHICILRNGIRSSLSSEEFWKFRDETFARVPREFMHGARPVRRVVSLPGKFLSDNKP